jgi:hypothetical protein
LPARLVEVDSEEETRLIDQERVDSCDERLSTVIMAGQVPANDVISFPPIVAMIAGARCLHAVTGVSSTAQKGSDDER